VSLHLLSDNVALIPRVKIGSDMMEGTWKRHDAAVYVRGFLLITWDRSDRTPEITAVSGIKCPLDDDER
jgi:hypothetical protein